jgi:hypothetical protein
MIFGFLVNKLNIKLGGLNYGIKMTELPDMQALYTSTLFIGISSNYLVDGIGFTLDTNNDSIASSVASVACETQLLPEAQEELATGPPTPTTVVGVFFFL